MELKIEHEGTDASFVDLDIYILLTGDLYTNYMMNANNFNFFIVRMPQISSNNPSSVFYRSVFSEFIRIAKYTPLFEDFISKAVELSRRKVGIDFHLVLKQIKKLLLEVMNELVDFCFQGGTHEQLSLAKYGAKWVSKNNRSGLRFTRSMVKDALEYLMYLMGNCYFTFGDKVFRQVIGIPMGSDPAPFMANLFLYYYESKWVKNLKKDSLQKARRFSHTFRFIDDLLTINDNNLFLQNLKIYILQSCS